MERKIKFIELKVTEKIINRDYFEYDEIKSLMNDGGLTENNVIRTLLDRVQPTAGLNIDRHILPISTICGRGKQDIHIVYSPEVSELFDKPINLIIEENYSTKNLLRKSHEEYASLKNEHNLLLLKTSTFWSRLKNLF